MIRKLFSCCKKQIPKESDDDLVNQNCETDKQNICIEKEEFEDFKQTNDITDEQGSIQVLSQQLYHNSPSISRLRINDTSKIEQINISKIIPNSDLISKKKKIQKIIKKQALGIEPSQDLIMLFPVHASVHWYCLALNYEQKSVFVYDSLPKVGELRVEKQIQYAVEVADTFFVLSYWIQGRFLKFRNFQIQAHNGERIKISYDSNGVPKVQSPSIQASIFGQGCLHIIHREWQMDKNRMLAQGRISQFFGQSSIQLDVTLRNFGIHKIGNIAYQKLEQEKRQDTLKIAKAYVNGINTCRKLGYFHSIQYYLLWIKDIEDWNPTDPFTLMGFLNFFLAKDFKEELIRARLDDIVGEEITNLLLPVFEEYTEDEKYTIMSDEQLKENGLYEPNWEDNVKKEITEGKRKDQRVNNLIYQKYAKKIQSPYSIPQNVNFVKQTVNVQIQSIENSVNEISGSNAWVISGNYTKSGKPILSNDPHLGNQAPSTWFLTYFYHPDTSSQLNQHVFGAGIPGLPGLFTGRTNSFAWGITALFTDVSDVYQETILQEQGKYMYNGKKEDLKSIKEIFKCKGCKADQVREIYYTHHGPLLHYYYPVGGYLQASMKNIRTKHNYAYAWTPQFISNDMWVSQSTAAFTIKDKKDVNKFVKNCRGPNFALVFALHSGDFGYIGCGDYPIRKPSENSFKSPQGKTQATVARHQRVQDGSTSETDWIGFISGDEVPHVWNSKKGYIMNGNNKIASQNAKYGIGSTATVTLRSKRASQLIESLIKRRDITAQDNIKIQYDNYDSVVVQIEEALMEIFKQDEEFKSKIPKLFGNNEDKQTGGNQHALSFYYILEVIMMKNFFKSFENNSPIFEVSLKRIILTATSSIHGELMFKNFLSESRQNKLYSKKKKDLFEYLCKISCNNNFNQINYNLQFLEQAPSQNNNNSNNNNNNNNSNNNPCKDLIKNFVEKALDYHKTETNSAKWSEIHKKTFKSVPLSMSPLRPLAERVLPTLGSKRPVHVQGVYYNSDTFDSAISGNVKFVTDLGDMDDQTKYISGYSLDLGQSSHLFSKYYDNFLYTHQDTLYAHPIYSKNKRDVITIKDE